MLINALKEIFLYSNSEPLLFTQLYFWIFFAVVLAVYSFIYKNKRVRNIWLFVVSLFFYYKSSGFFFSILLVSTFIDFFVGKAIYKSQKTIYKKIFLSISIISNLFILSFFKYSYFYTQNFNEIFGTHFQPVNIFAQWFNAFAGTHFEVDNILLPVGISFYTFQTISYSVDVYRAKIKPVNNILDFGFYVSFFPQLVAGPIVRASDFIPQIYKDYVLSKKEFGHALFLILNGLTKKIVLGDFIAVHFIDRVFDNPAAYSGFENLMSLYGYSLQVYADFSGYTDIAIGVALLMGFRLPINFNSPYKAHNVGNFWKRWHISLSSWLKDYLYIPIGGNRKGTLASYILLSLILLVIMVLAKSVILPFIILALIILSIVLAHFIPAFKQWINTNINIMITMLLGGLWHGASWMFVIWGGLNGLGLVVYKLWRKISPWEGKKMWYVRFWTIFLTFNFITFTRIWFRGDSLTTANTILHQIYNNFGLNIVTQVVSAYYDIFLLMLAGYVIHWLPVSFKEMYRGAFIKSSIAFKLIFTVIVVFILYQFHTSDFKPFIYFQF